MKYVYFRILDSSSFTIFVNRTRTPTRSSDVGSSTILHQYWLLSPSAHNIFHNLRRGFKTSVHTFSASSSYNPVVCIVFSSCFDKNCFKISATTVVFSEMYSNLFSAYRPSLKFAFLLSSCALSCSAFHCEPVNRGTGMRCKTRKEGSTSRTKWRVLGYCVFSVSDSVYVFFSGQHSILDVTAAH
jgi:hypothetical protein